MNLVCKTCGERKPVESFHVRRANKSGRACRCSRCVNLSIRIRRGTDSQFAEHRAKMQLAADKKFKSKYPGLYRSRKHTAARKNVAELSRSYIRHLVRSSAKSISPDAVINRVLAKRTERMFGLMSAPKI